MTGAVSTVHSSSNLSDNRKGKPLVGKNAKLREPCSGNNDNHRMEVTMEPAELPSLVDHSQSFADESDPIEIPSLADSHERGFSISVVTQSECTANIPRTEMKKQNNQTFSVKSEDPRNENFNTTIANKIDCTRIMLSSLTCFTSCLICSSGENRKDFLCCCPQFCLEKGEKVSPNPNFDETETKKKVWFDIGKDVQQQQVRKFIEMDILAIIGCTDDSSASWMGRFGDSLFCEVACTKSKNVPEKEPNPAKIRNRNVFNRDKAIRRIKRLREGGLSRTFSLAPVSDFLEEEMNGMGNLAEAYNSKSSKSLELTSTVEVSKRTSFLRKFDQQYPIQSTNSAEYVTLQRPSRVKHFNTNKINRDKKGSFSVTADSSAMLKGQFDELVSIMRAPTSDSGTSAVELYYDSDPGCDVKNESKLDLKPKRSSSTRTNSAKWREKQTREKVKSGNIIENVVAVVENDIDEPSLFNAEENSITDSSSINTATALLDTVDVATFDVNNGLLVKQFIDELTNGFISLIWHPRRSQKEKSSSNPPPICVQAWFEMGTCLKSTLVQPKFMWRGDHRPDDATRYGNVQGPVISNPHNIELLNIIRVLSPTTIDRKIYPFVKVNNAFILSTSAEESFLFEAATEEERNKVVLGLKLVVARLASKIIVGDKGVFQEFFSPWGSMKKSKGKKSSDKVKKKQPNFIAQSVNEEGVRTNELWGST